MLEYGQGALTRRPWQMRQLRGWGRAESWGQGPGEEGEGARDVPAVEVEQDGLWLRFRLADKWFGDDGWRRAVREGWEEEAEEAEAAEEAEEVQKVGKGEGEESAGFPQYVAGVRRGSDREAAARNKNKSRGAGPDARGGGAGRGAHVREGAGASNPGSASRAEVAVSVPDYVQVKMEEVVQAAGVQGVAGGRRRAVGWRCLVGFRNARLRFVWGWGLGFS